MANEVKDLTVVIPTLGVRSGALRRAIESCCGIETVVVDDGTPDDSVKMLTDELGARYVRRGSNGGVAAAQNTGLGEVRTEWVQFLHSDDLLPASARSAIRPLQCDVVEGYLEYSTGLRVQPVLGRSEAEFLRHAVSLHICNYQFRVDFLERLRFDDALRCWEDWDLLYRTRQAEPTILSVPITVGFVVGAEAGRLSHSPVMADGFELLYRKYAAIGVLTRQQRSVWEYKLARLSFRSGARRAGLRWALRSTRTDPIHPRRTVQLIRSAIEGRPARALR